MTASQQPKTVDATVYLQVDPEWRAGYWRDASDNLILGGAKVVRHTLQRPTKPKPGTVLVKVTLRVPAGAFLPLRPGAVVIVPESLTETTPVEVTVEDPA